MTAGPGAKGPIGPPREKYVRKGLHIPTCGCYDMEQEQSRNSIEAEPADG